VMCCPKSRVESRTERGLIYDATGRRSVRSDQLCRRDPQGYMKLVDYIDKNTRGSIGSQHEEGFQQVDFGVGLPVGKSCRGLNYERPSALSL
jgi:hypothetical protein